MRTIRDFLGWPKAHSPMTVVFVESKGNWLQIASGCLVVGAALLWPMLPATLAKPSAAVQAVSEQVPEKSVKPGINESWKSDKIEPLIQMLEAESREIYRERENLAALTVPRRGAVIADIGAGSGFMVEEFSKLVGPSGKVYAVDINPKLVERIAQRAREEGLSNIEAVLGQEDSAGLRPGSVDIVFLCDTYHHFEYPRSMMKSIYEALKPEGELVLVEFQRIPGESADWLLDHVRAGEEVFIQEILEAGFELVNQPKVPYLKENYVLRFRKVEKPLGTYLPLLLPALRVSSPAAA